MYRVIEIFWHAADVCLTFPTVAATTVDWFMITCMKLAKQARRHAKAKLDAAAIVQ